MTYNFEAKLHGFRRTQDGVVISYVCHPDDVSAEMAVASLGTRYMVAASEIGEDEKPKDLARIGVEYRQSPEQPAKPNADRAKPQVRVFSELPMSQQAALRCNDLEFQLFASLQPGAAEKGDIVSFVRSYCGIRSRSELDLQQEDGSSPERRLWEGLETKFQAWRTDRQFASVRHG